MPSFFTSAIEFSSHPASPSHFCLFGMQPFDLVPQAPSFIEAIASCLNILNVFLSPPESDLVLVDSCHSPGPYQLRGSASSLPSSFQPYQMTHPMFLIAWALVCCCMSFILLLLASLLEGTFCSCYDHCCGSLLFFFSLLLLMLVSTVVVLL